MIKIKRFCLYILLITILITFTGCWNYREINNLSLAAGFAVDKDIKENKYILTTEILVPKQKNSAAIQSSAFIQAKSDTIFKAMRNTIRSNGKMIYWSHCKVLIISEKVAKEGVVQVLDIVDRNPELRPDISFLVASEQNAEKIFTASKEKDNVTAYKFRDAMENQPKAPSYTGGDAWDFINDLMKEGIEPTASLINIVYKDGKAEFQIGGIAVFKRDKMVGKLTEKEAEAFLYIINKAKDGVIALDKKSSNLPENLSLEILKNQCKMRPGYSNGKLVMNLDINLDVGITEIEGPEDVIKPDKRKQVEKATAEYLKKDILNVIAKAQQEYDSDIFGFGKSIRNNLPSAWNKVKANWDDEFKTLSTEVNIKVNVVKTSLTSEPIKPGD